MIQTSENNCTQVVFLSDALSVLQAFQNNKLPSLSRALWQVAHTRRTVLQWIPAHCGVPGNEQADTLAKRGAKMSQPNNSITYSEKKSIIKALTAPAILKDDYHLLSREQQTVLVRLRTGHNRLNNHMYRKLKLVPSPTCPCGQEDQTTDHVLQRCTLLDAIRKEVWPHDTALTTKLHGCRQELEKTASFIARTGVIV